MFAKPIVFKISWLAGAGLILWGRVRVEWGVVLVLHGVWCQSDNEVLGWVSLNCHGDCWVQFAASCEHCILYKRYIAGEKVCCSSKEPWQWGEGFH
jgi:hypothetical protein